MSFLGKTFKWVVAPMVGIAAVTMTYDRWDQAFTDDHDRDYTTITAPNANYGQRAADALFYYLHKERGITFSAEQRNDLDKLRDAVTDFENLRINKADTLRINAEHFAQTRYSAARQAEYMRYLDNRITYHMTTNGYDERKACLEGMHDLGQHMQNTAPTFDYLADLWLHQRMYNDVYGHLTDEEKEYAREHNIEVSPELTRVDLYSYALDLPIYSTIREFSLGTMDELTPGTGAAKFHFEP